MKKIKVTKQNNSRLPGLSVTVLTVTVLTVTVLIATVLTVAATTAFAADAKHGKKLYTEKCGGCHDTRVHTRPNRIVHTYEDLVNRVRFCDTNAKTNFKDSEILDVSEYLNNDFYKFLKIDS